MGLVAWALAERWWRVVGKSDGDFARLLANLTATSQRWYPAARSPVGRPLPGHGIDSLGRGGWWRSGGGRGTRGEGQAA